MTWKSDTGLPSPYVAAIEEIISYFDGKTDVDALVLTGSWARGKGNVSLGADCDLTLLHSRHFDLAGEMAAYKVWQEEREKAWNLGSLGPYSFIELHSHDGGFVPKPRQWTSGPDDFELEIGNTLVYSRPISTWTDRFQHLQEQWLPYYSEDLRNERLAMVMMYVRNNLNHIHPYSERGLFFQCLKRLHHALEETLQALFIKARRYPIAYDKWIEEQVSGVLGRPDLYTLFVQVVTLPKLDAQTLQEKTSLLFSVLDKTDSER